MGQKRGENLKKIVHAAIDKLSRGYIIPPNTLKDFEEDEYASYGGQRTG